VRIAGQKFYSERFAGPFTRQEILNGQVIKINPALITMIDGLVRTTPAAKLQQQVIEQVHQLLAYGVRTFHVDVNFEDYSGYGLSRPDLNGVVFSPAFLQDLNQLVVEGGAYLNLHLLTDAPLRHFAEYAAVGAGAICFQLDATPDPKTLAELLDSIDQPGACASPVIETVGSESLPPRSREDVRALLEPVVSQIGMLTFQAAGTASRSNRPAGQFAAEEARAYISFLREGFRGTIQIQGGMTSGTIGRAVQLGAEFIVCGSEIFRNRESQPATVVIDRLLQQAAQALGE
jgi:pentose-5-phosphate-3-epimerase